ncbi:hypothetical protein [Cupriavidus taiwanensis]|uniref:Uncharacterized protein n=1 Tax=Cupriavidus taiwanensis TaxID=164546 RepID=A0A375JCN4_9BURK|nr:hypothetical protein [Cupriavidus taiwanensis]SPS02945.1 conserved hypothetical protein [Cupriavidus taiwanensis]
MYVISIGSARSEMRTTLAGVLEYLNQDRRGVAAPRSADVTVRHVERGDIAVHQLKSGRMAVRPRGTARSILVQILDEVERYVVRVDGKVLRPHEMSRASWGAVVAAGRLAFFPEEAIDLAAAEAGPLFHTRDLFEAEGPFDIAAFVDNEFRRRFGYGRQGPAYAPDASPNARHVLHVAYALLRGEKVRECVLSAYRDDPEIGKHDLTWLRPLIEVPALRGALSPAQLQGLCHVMRHDGLKITADNAGKLLAIVRRLPVDCGVVQVDDALFSAGILQPRTAAAFSAAQGPAATPVSPLAQRIHAITTQRRFDATMERAKAQREALEISQRHFDDLARRAVADRTCAGYDWANMVALAVLQRDVAAVLEIFDSPKDWNTDSKRALREVTGVDLLQCTAALRRRRIFELCGFSPAEQARWEHEAAAAKADRVAAREFEDARKRAEASNWRLEGGKVLNGREYVDFCISEGFSEIIDMPRGRARAYRICNPRRGMSRPLRAKDGTLSYARARLAQAAVPAAIAA